MQFIAVSPREETGLCVAINNVNCVDQKHMGINPVSSGKRMLTLQELSSSGQAERDLQGEGASASVSLL